MPPPALVSVVKEPTSCAVPFGPLVSSLTVPGNDPSTRNSPRPPGHINQSPVALAFDANDQRVSQINADVAYASTQRSFAVPHGVAIAQIKTTSQASEYGVLQLAVSPLGQTDTYAVRLQASGGRNVWFVVLGASGQCLRFDEEDDVEELFSLQRGAIRHDAR